MKQCRQCWYSMFRWVVVLGVLLVVLAGVGSVRGQQPIVPQTQLSPVIVHGGRQLMTAYDWQPFEVRGVNYIRPTTADPTLCPEILFAVSDDCPWEPNVIASDMTRLRNMGVNTVRVFVNFYTFGGFHLHDSSYDIEPALRHFGKFIDIANSHGIYVMPVLMAKYPQQSHFDAQMFETVMQYHVRPVVQRFAGHAGILAWDLFNEPDIAGPVDVRCWDWDNRSEVFCFNIAIQRHLFLNMLHDEVKRLDLYTPVTISVAFAKSYFRPEGAYSVRLADMVDFYSFHYYDNDPYDSGRYAQHWYYGEGFPRDLERSIDELHALGLGKPVVITEVGFPSGEGAVRSLEEVHRDLRTVLQTSREHQASGIVLWQFQEEPELLVGELFR